MTAKKTKSAVKHHHIPMKEKEPDYVVQIQDPRMVRKQLLESLRDLIIFMQGYEQFRRLQEQKVTQFTALRNDVKELNHLLDAKLRHHFPKGKVKPITNHTSKPVIQEPEEEMEEEKVVAPVRMPVRKEAPAPTPKRNDLDELEQQLRDIENQLRGVK